MTVLDDIPQLETEGMILILCRHISNEFWKACIERVKTNDISIRVAAIGNPGIGKTTNTPILIRMLYEKGEPVVYQIRTSDKTGLLYEFIPTIDGATKRSVQVTLYPQALPLNKITNLQAITTYYIVDPGEMTDSCSRPADFKPKIIIMASPNERHWGQSTKFVKRQVKVDGFLMFYPMGSLKQLIAARAEWGKLHSMTLTEEEVCERVRWFGPIPGHVFSQNMTKLNNQQITALNCLNLDQVKQISLGKESALGTFASSKAPKSTLMGIFILRQTDAEIRNEVGTTPVDEMYVPVAVGDVYDDNDPTITKTPWLVFCQTRCKFAYTRSFWRIYGETW
jgi:hypothetical protein